MMGQCGGWMMGGWWDGGGWMMGWWMDDGVVDGMVDDMDGTILIARNMAEMN
jgi:hypothetical protein